MDTRIQQRTFGRVDFIVDGLAELTKTAFELSLFCLRTHGQTLDHPYRPQPDRATDPVKPDMIQN